MVLVRVLKSVGGLEVTRISCASQGGLRNLIKWKLISPVRLARDGCRKRRLWRRRRSHPTCWTVCENIFLMMTDNISALFPSFFNSSASL